MKIGLLLLRSDPIETVDFGIKNGFSAIEASLENYVDSISSATIANLSQKCAAAGATFSVHAPSIDLNLSSFNNGIRNESIRQIKKSIEICAGLVEHITIHTNYYPGMRKLGSFERIIVGLNEIADEAENQDVCISIENVHERSIDQLFDYMMLVDNDSFKLTIDIAHSVAYGGFKPQYAIMVLSKYINNIHLSDNDGVNDLHLPLGTGKIYFNNILKQLVHMDYKKGLIIEAKSMQDAITSKNYLEKKLVMLFPQALAGDYFFQRSTN